MTTRVLFAWMLVLGCTVAGPVDDPEESTSTSGANDTGESDEASATQGQSSTTSAVTGVTATSTTTNATSTAGTTEPDDSATSTTTGADPTGEDVTTSASDTGSPREQCGIEIAPGGGPYEAGCACETCDLYWDDLDEASFSLIVDDCECLCQAAGCGSNVGGEVAGGVESDSGDKGESEGSSSR